MPIEVICGNPFSENSYKNARKDMDELEIQGYIPEIMSLTSLTGPSHIPDLLFCVLMHKKEE